MTLTENKEGPLSVLELPAHLKSSYRRLVLVSDFDQALIHRDPEALTVTSDWLAWRKLTDLGEHALHYEAMLDTWPDALGNPDDHFIDSSAWVYENGVDVTLFRGVSLGKQLNRHMGYLRAAYYRQWHALDRLCERFQPNQVAFHDIRVEADILDRETLIDLVYDVASRRGIDVEIGPPPETEPPQVYPISSMRSVPVDKPGNNILRDIYLHMVTILFRARFAFSGRKSRKPRVFLFLNWHCVRNILENIAGHEVTPVIQAEPWPKSFRFIWNCLRRGVLQTRLPGASLDPSDRQEITAIINKINARQMGATDGIEAAQMAFAVRHLTDHGWIWERACEVKRYQRMINNVRIDRTVVGDSENATCSLIAEVAKGQGVPSDELLNGLFVSGQLTDNRCVDRGGREPIIARLLSWGEQNDKWLVATRSPLPSVRTGYPGLDEFKRQTSLPASPKPSKALILPAMPTADNPVALYAETFANVVGAARALRAAGYTELRLKIHPGYVSTRPYFEQVLAYHGVECEVKSEGELKDHALWADVVVGPINSGSLVETLAIGRRYYPFQSLPTALRPELFGGARVYHSGDDLRVALEKSEPCHSKSILRKLCSTDEIVSASDRFWQVMEETFSARKSET
jgi:hypothetical protein